MISRWRSHKKCNSTVAHADVHHYLRKKCIFSLCLILNFLWQTVVIWGWCQTVLHYRSSVVVAYLINYFSVVWFFQVYRGPDRTYRLTGLTAKSDYQVRVHAVRHTKDDNSASITLTGPFSTSTPFCTRAVARTVNASATATGTSSASSLHDWMSNPTWMFILILVAFMIFAIVVAFVASAAITQLMPDIRLPEQSSGAWWLAVVKKFQTHCRHFGSYSGWPLVEKTWKNRIRSGNWFLKIRSGKIHK